jgi:hypothetical protein
VPLHNRLPLLLLLACGSTSSGTDPVDTETTTECIPEGDRPSAEARAACDGATWPDTDATPEASQLFWQCCEVWRQECLATCGEDCEWICNG